MNDRLGRIIKSKWTRWAGIALVVLIFATFLISRIFFQPWLRKELETKINEQSNGLYTLRMVKFSASLAGGSVTIDSLVLLPDTARWMQLRQENKPDLTSQLTHLKAEKLKLTGINYVGLLFNKPLNLNQVLLHKPVVHINQMKTDTTDSEPLHEALSGPMKNMQVKKIRIEDGTFSYKKNYRHQYNAAEVKGINVTIGNVKLDSAAYQASDRIFYTKQIQASARQTNFLTPGGFNRIKTGAVSAESGDSAILVKNLAVIPVYKPAELARRKGEASTWMDIRVPEVTMNRVDFKALSENGDVEIASIVFKNAKMKAFKDKLNFSPKTTRPLPHDLVQDFKKNLDIGKIEIRNMFIRYDELGADAKRPGHMEFYNLNATITNVNNDKSRMTAENPAIAKLSFSIEGKSRLNCTIRLPLLDKNGYHTITGTVGKSDLTVMNSIIEPAYFVSFKSGSVEKGSFNLKLNRNKATGLVKLNYSDFEIDMLSKSEEKKQSLPKKVLSKIANKTVVKDENKPDDGGLRTADINVTRQRNRSVFTYWKDCLEQGLLISAGIEKFQPGK